MTDTRAGALLPRIAAVAYGGFAYGAFLASNTYLIGFLAGVGVPKGIDDGDTGSTALAVVVDVVLLTVFALQHSVMARPGFKRVWTRVVPTSVERSTYVLVASAILALLMWQWRPLDGVVWSAGPDWARAVLWAGFGLGWTICLVSTFQIGHYDLFGISQVLARWRRRAYVSPSFTVPGLYKLVRHPLYLGFIVAFWSAPDMSVGLLLFAGVNTGYILVAIRFEERDLTVELGAPYEQYVEQVPRLLPGARPSGVRGRALGTLSQ